MTPIHSVIDKIVAASIKGISASLQCSEKEAADHYSHGVADLLKPKEADTEAKPAPSVPHPSRARRTPTFERITLDQLRDKYYYDTELGELRYKNDGYKYRRDDVAWWYGNGPRQPLKMVYHNGFNYNHARLVWMFHKGGTLPREVLHKNGDRLDDRIENLCDADKGLVRRNASWGANPIWKDETPGEKPSRSANASEGETVEEHVAEPDDGIDIDWSQDFDAALLHRNAENPWCVFLVGSDTLTFHGSFLTIAEAYAVWRKVTSGK